MKKRLETKCKITRFLTTLSCVLFGMFIMFNMNRFETIMIEDVIPYVHSHMKSQNVEILNINSSFDKILDENNEIVDVVLFKFIPDSTNSDFIKGQISITVQSRDNSPSLNKKEVYSLGNNKIAFQEIMLNKVHYENITSLRTECQEFFNTSENFTCKSRQYVNISYKTIVTIPISDKDGYSIIGYILLTLNREYDNSQVAKMVRDIQPHIPSVQESMVRI